MNTYTALLRTTLRWNILEQLIYQPLLFAHGTGLLAILGAHNYGKLSVAMGIAYGLSILLNLGLDPCLGPLFTQASSSKKFFSQTMIRQLWFQAGIMIFAIILSLLVPLGQLALPITIVATSESLRKTIKTILQLGFYTRVTASSQVALIAGYISIIWGSYLLGFASFSTEFLLYTLGGCHCAVLVVLLLFIHKLYQTIPDTEPIGPAPSFGTMRSFNVLNQFRRQLFSGNFLIPLVGASTNFSTAGALSFLSSCLYFVTSLIKKSLIPTSSALFSFTKHREPTEHKHALLTYTSNRLIVALALLIASSVITAFFAITMFNFSAIKMSTIYLCLLLQCLECLVSLYESFFLTEDRLLQWTQHSLIICTSVLIANIAAGPHAALIVMFAGQTISCGFLLRKILQLPFISAPITFLASILLLACAITLNMIYF